MDGQMGGWVVGWVGGWMGGADLLHSENAADV